MPQLFYNLSLTERLIPHHFLVKVELLKSNIIMTYKVTHKSMKVNSGY